METHSISAGLDYPGVGPEHSYLKTSGRAQYVAVKDTEALEAIQLLSRCEGIIPALEPAHAIAHVMKLAPTMAKTDIILLNMCGRGDKVGLSSCLGRIYLECGVACAFHGTQPASGDSTSIPIQLH